MASAEVVTKCFGLRILVSSLALLGTVPFATSIGPAVDAAAQEYADTLGARVLKIHATRPKKLSQESDRSIAHENGPLAASSASRV